MAKQRIWTFSLAVFCIIFFGGTAAKAIETVTLQLKWKHQFQFAGYYAAIHQGYYLEEGLDVHLIEGKPGGKEVEEVVRGNANFGVGMSDILLSRLEGKPIVLIANIFQHSPVTLLTVRKSGYTSPQDFFKKAIRMVEGVKSAELQAMFLNEGIAVTDLNISTPRWNLEDLLSGEVDAIAAYISSQPYILKKQFIPYTLISPLTYGIDFYGDNLFTSEAEIAGHPDRVVAFRKASLRGWQYALENPEEIVDLILSKYAETNKHLDRNFLLNEATSYQNLILPDFVQLGHTNPGRWKHIADTYVRLGMADPDYSFDGFFFQPENKQFSWNHWSVQISLFLIITGGGATLVLSIFNRRLKREILAHQKTGKELEESEEKFRALFDQAGGYCMVLDPSTSDGIPVILDANKAACLMHGYTREEFIGRPVSVIDDEAGKELVKKRTSEIMTGKPFYVENEHVRKDGTVFSVAVNAKRIDIGGKPPYILSTEYDITDRKRVEKELIEREEQYRVIAESIGDYIMRYDRKGKHIYANRNAIEVTGLPEEQYIGKTHREMGFPEHLCELWEDNIENVFTTGTPINVEFDVEMHDGLMTFDLHLNPEFSDDGSVQSVIGISRDISDRKITEVKLRDSIHNLNEAVKAGRIGLWSRDLKTKKITYSSEWKRQIGFEDHEIQNSYSEWEKRVHPDDIHPTIAAIDKSIKEINHNHRTEFRFRHKDGSYRWFLSQASFMLDNEGQPTKMLGSHIDISDIKQIEEDLEKHKNHLEHIIEERNAELKNAQTMLLQKEKLAAIGKLSGSVAHDIRNPLGIISNSIYFLGQIDTSSLDHRVEKHINIMEIAIERASGIITDLMDFSRDNRPDLKEWSINEEILSLCEELIVQEDISLEYELDSNLQPFFFDPQQIRRVLHNLFINALQAMPEGGLLKIYSKMNDGFVEVKIIDNGIGIKPEDIEHIYEPLFTTKSKGVGLGLSIVKTFVENHCGTINIESVVGKGTAFTVALPFNLERSSRDRA